MGGFETLQIWQIAHELTLEIYGATGSFPREERFGLTMQIRRAAASIGANIAEGYGRHNTQDTVRFLYIARGSLMEVRNFLYVARDLTFLDSERAVKLLQLTSRLSVKLTNAVEALGRAKSLRELPAEYLDEPSELITT